jgi:hypothetical protein
LYLVSKTRRHCCVVLELDGFDSPHEVPVVEIMAVVVAKHAAIIRLAN